MALSCKPPFIACNTRLVKNSARSKRLKILHGCKGERTSLTHSLLGFDKAARLRKLRAQPTPQCESAVQSPRKRVENQFRAFEAGIGSQGYLAPSIESAHDAAFSRHAYVGDRIAHKSANASYGFVISAYLEPNRPLPYGGNHNVDRECFDDFALPTHTLYPSGGQNDSVKRSIAHFSYPGIQVPSNLHVLEIVAHRSQLSKTTKSTRSHTRAGRQGSERRARHGNEGIAGIRSFQAPRKHKTFRQHRGNVFHGVNAYVYTTIEQGLLELFRKQPFVTYF